MSEEHVARLIRARKSTEAIQYLASAQDKFLNLELPIALEDPYNPGVVVSRTLYLWAATYDLPDVMGVLREQGANTIATTSFGDDALSIACRRGHVGVVVYLLSVAENDPVSLNKGLCVAAFNNQLEIVKIFKAFDIQFDFFRVLYLAIKGEAQAVIDELSKELTPNQFKVYLDEEAQEQNVIKDNKSQSTWDKVKEHYHQFGKTVSSSVQILNLLATRSSVSINSINSEVFESYVEAEQAQEQESYTPVFHPLKNTPANSLLDLASVAVDVVDNYAPPVITKSTPVQQFN